MASFAVTQTDLQVLCLWLVMTTDLSCIKPIALIDKHLSNAPRLLPWWLWNMRLSPVSSLRALKRSDMRQSTQRNGTPFRSCLTKQMIALEPVGVFRASGWNVYRLWTGNQYACSRCLDLRMLWMSARGA